MGVIYNKYLNNTKYLDHFNKINYYKHELAIKSYPQLFN